MTPSETKRAAARRVELAQRQHSLAETLRSIVAAAPGDETVSRLATLAQRWEDEPADPRTIASLLEEMDAARATVARRLPTQPLLAARRVSAALERVKAGRTYTDVVRLAPAELCWAGDFDRVLLSRIDGLSWRPEAWHAAGSSHSAETMAFGEYVRAADEIPLGSGMIEAEVVRRRRTVLVPDAAAEPRTFSALLDVAGCTSYIVAPIVAGDGVVGLLHADGGVSGRTLGEVDRITLRSFADGLGLVLERLALLERLATQRDQISAALAAAEQAVDALAVAPVSLETASAPDASPVSTQRANVPFDGILTSREREVFAVLISGATNAEIADRLTVSETTVKSHVKHILRKLRASNRAEAIAKYLALSGNQARSA